MGVAVRGVTVVAVFVFVARVVALLPEGVRSRIPELTERQLIALRFASDGELAGLAQKALNEKLSPDDIKKSIKNWRADNWRV